MQSKIKQLHLAIGYTTVACYIKHRSRPNPYFYLCRGTHIYNLTPFPLWWPRQGITSSMNLWNFIALIHISTLFRLKQPKAVAFWGTRTVILFYAFNVSALVVLCSRWCPFPWKTFSVNADAGEIWLIIFFYYLA